MLEQFPVRREQKAIELPHFPTRLQAVIWRNWGLVPVERLAPVLQATVEQIADMAVLMGLEANPPVQPYWLTNGYITIIRANWHLLSYDQLLLLLDWEEDRLAFALKEDDFLWIKLGSFKPYTEPVVYRPLQDDERKRTGQMALAMGKFFPPEGREEYQRPFAFVQELRQPPAARRSGYDARAEGSRVRRPAGTVQVTAAWEVRIGDVRQSSDELDAFVDRFIVSCERDWGFRPAYVHAHSSDAANDLALETESGRGIHLRIVSDIALLAESHAIEVSETSIDITAVDPIGLLRGLQWLTQSMARNGGPYVPLGTVRRATRFDLRYVYSYFGVYGDPFTDEEQDPYPDGLLERLSELGVNGIWLQSVLYSLVPWEKAPHLSVGWERRVAGLRRLVERAAAFGIGVYLYMNEPRAMLLPFFDRYPEFKGHEKDHEACLCTSVPEVQQLLKHQVASLFREVPRLAGLFTITASENLTNCYSKAKETNCPRCASRSAEEVVAEVNRLIAEGARSVKPDVRILCWNWGWVNWERDKMHRAISLLPDHVSVISTSERSKTTLIAGVAGAVSDYSISVVGPSEMSQGVWRAARERGLSAVAKAQVNNSWENAAVPYLPVLDQIDEHLRNLLQEGVSGLMLSWTLGGYPSLNLELAASYYWDHSSVEGISEKEEALTGKYGMAAGKKIVQACASFSKAFREFPFHVRMLYRGPQNVGPANPLYLAPTGYDSTMVCYPYDDVHAWRSIYPPSVFAAQLGKLSRGWQQGLRQLERAKALVPPTRQSAYRDLESVAHAAWIHFHSAWLQTRFYLQRERMLKTKSERLKAELAGKMAEIVKEELELARRLHGLMQRDARIGFEASNHYFYTAQDLREKTLNCLNVLEQLEQVQFTLGRK
ncbi:MAG: hypothetical protein K0Q59_2980 [Paenibacillus sp.]|nr:hypothetical protein [Paenibacillus sp.]